MKMLTKEIERALPSLYATEGVPLKDKIIQVKFFNPCGRGRWYGIEYDPASKEFFGVVELFETELGYFNLSELEALRLPFGMHIERDLYFKPRKVADVFKEGSGIL